MVYRQRPPPRQWGRHMGFHRWYLQNKDRVHQDPYQLPSVSLSHLSQSAHPSLRKSHRQGILSILSIPDTPPATKPIVAAALLNRDSVEFETEAASRGMCATALRSSHEWGQHPHAQALANTPPVTLVKIGDAPKRSATGTPSRPLDGIRVLDLSRVLAGPVAGRTLAGQSIHWFNTIWAVLYHSFTHRLQLTVLIFYL